MLAPQKREWWISDLHQQQLRKATYSVPVLSKNAVFTFPATKMPSWLVQVIRFLWRRLAEIPTDTTNTVGSNGGSIVPTTNMAEGKRRRDQREKPQHEAREEQARRRAQHENQMAISDP